MLEVDLSSSFFNLGNSAECSLELRDGFWLCSGRLCSKNCVVEGCPNIDIECFVLML